MFQDVINIPTNKSTESIRLIEHKVISPTGNMQLRWEIWQKIVQSFSGVMAA